MTETAASLHEEMQNMNEVLEGYDRHPLLIYPDPRLELVCDEVPGEMPAGEVWDTLDLMWETMRKYGGVGLAAPQIGCPKRMIICHVEGGCKIELVNPTLYVSKRHGRSTASEGCLSQPSVRVMVKRYNRCKVTGFNRYMEPVTFGGKGFQAAVLQHEMDHLDGINIGRS